MTRRAAATGAGAYASQSPVRGRTATKKPRMPWWPTGVDSELEMKLYTRLQHAGLPLGEGQVRFVPGRQYRWDRCWKAEMVAVEVQGAIYANGAHSRGSGVQRDCVKHSIGAALGWRLLPITEAMLDDGSAIDLIRQALEHEGRRALGAGE